MTKREITIDGILRQVEFMRLEFPGSHAPPPPPELPTGAITTGQLAREQRKRELAESHWQRIQDRRAELMRMTTEQRDSLAAQLWRDHEKSDRERREKQTPKAYEPEWQFWIRRSEEWQLFEAALLLVNLEPRKGLGLYLKGILRGEYDYGDYDETRLTGKTREAMRNGEMLSDAGIAKLKEAQEIVSLSRVARRRNTLARLHDDSGREVVEPGKFLNWARSKGYEIPLALTKLITEGQKPKPATAPDHIARPAAQGHSHAAPRIAPPKGRRDVIMTVIDKLVQETDDAQSMWLKLRDMAFAKKQPFTGEIKGDALIYMDTVNGAKEITLRNLRGRLTRRAARSLDKSR